MQILLHGGPGELLLSVGSEGLLLARERLRVLAPVVLGPWGQPGVWAMKDALRFLGLGWPAWCPDIVPVRQPKLRGTELLKSHLEAGSLGPAGRELGQLSSAPCHFPLGFPGVLSPSSSPAQGFFKQECRPLGSSENAKGRRWGGRQDPENNRSQRTA